MNGITEKLLGIVSDWAGSFNGAFNIREKRPMRRAQSTAHIKNRIQNRRPRLGYPHSARHKGESVSIPACVTHGDVDDLVYNDFFVGDGADVTIVAGCGVHTDDGEPARHNGIHRFFLGRDAHVVYLEKHIGTGGGSGKRSIDPVTEATLAEGAILEMDTSQLGGVDDTTRTTRATRPQVQSCISVSGSSLRAASRRELILKFFSTERTLAWTSFPVLLPREILIRLTARVSLATRAAQATRNVTPSLRDNGTVTAAPELTANSGDAALIHEAAIGKIAGEQLLRLRTLGLTEEEAEAKIVAGFLK